MKIKNTLVLDDRQLNRINGLYERYKQLYNDPDNCSPMFIINVPVDNLPDYHVRFHNPDEMLKAELEELRPHLEMEDDRAPTVRVQFGTGQIASAFGCETDVPDNNFPGTKGHVINSHEDVFNMRKPLNDAGLYKKLKIFTEAFLEDLPDGVHIQHPDIQSPFNNAHLIRGNDLFLDLFDAPDAVNSLLDIITDYMIDMVFYLKEMISTDNEWFFDWGALWKGAARISNCSNQMISPEMYATYVLPRDIRIMKEIGGGRIHYCGTSGKVVDEFFKNPEISGLDYDSYYHDFWDMAERAPRNVVLCQYVDFKSETGQRLLSGNWPKKRNIIIESCVGSIEEGKEMLQRLRNSVPDYR